MSREFRKKTTENYNFTRQGAYGIFSPHNAQPLEYILTSFTVDELYNLSFARDLDEHRKDFDFLIQRDIDEERARKEIGTYITAQEDGKDKITFLPPLIAAIVEVDNDNKIKPFYPSYTENYENDEYGGELTRTWPRLFRVKNYINNESGINVATKVNEKPNYKLDITIANLDIFLPPNGAGGRLVVIDGQHRLFALKFLHQFEREKIRNLSIPVCIVYPPLSTQENKNIDNRIIEIPTVLRKLFVDVNSTVEKVSGHFLTLLSDDNIGSFICREFCDTVLKSQELGELGLGQVEWNTKNYKESKNISKPHSITSIGVIHSVLEDTFSKGTGLNNLIKILDIGTELDSKLTIGGQNDNESESEDICIADDFPWRNFQFIPKETLKNKIKENIATGLKSIFFNVTPFKEAATAFDNLINCKLNEIKESKDIYSTLYYDIKNYYLLNDPIQKLAENELRCKAKISELNEWYVNTRNVNSLDYIFYTVFQKGYISSYLELIQLLSESGLKEPERTNLFILLANRALNKSRDMFSHHLTYMQTTVFNGPKIKVTKKSSSQIKRLMLANLGSPDLLTEIKEKLSVSSELIRKLDSIGKNNASNFFTNMRNDKEKAYPQIYRYSLDITIEDKKRIEEAEEKRNSGILSSVEPENKIDASLDSEQIIKRVIQKDLVKSANALKNNLGYDDFFYLVSDDENEEHD